LEGEYHNSSYNYGIWVTLASNAYNFVITGNSFYQTICGNGAASVAAIGFYAGNSSIGNVISNNFIGGSLPLAAAGSSPAYWCQYTALGVTYQNANLIDVQCGQITIDNNVIKNIRVGSNDHALTLINITGSTSATISNNQFGDNNINYKVNNSSVLRNAILKGIVNTSSGTVTADHNLFVNLRDSTGDITNYGSQLTLISFTGGSDNSQITNNTIRSCQSAGGNRASATGIYVGMTPVARSNWLISGNTIEIPGSVLSYGSFQGIWVVDTADFSITVSNNRIYDNHPSSHDGEAGIGMGFTGFGSHYYTVCNNEISLTCPSGSFDISMYGISDQSCNGSGSMANYLYNTVYIGGVASGNNQYSEPFTTSGCDQRAAAPMNIRNNIFINTRTGGTNPHHYAVGGSGYHLPGWGVGESDYNLFMTKGNFSTWSNVDQVTFDDYRTVSGCDAYSINAKWTAATSSYIDTMLNPASLFSNLNTVDLHIKTTDGESYKFVAGKGVPVAVTMDYDTTVRNFATPDIGMDEINGLPTGMKNTIVESSFTLYPNPASDQLTIHSSSFNRNETITASIMNMLGETLKDEKINWHNEESINIKSLPAGIYVLLLKFENYSIVKKFVKE